MLAAVAAGLLLLYGLLVAALWVAYRRNDDIPTLRQVVRMLPDLLRLLRRLVADPTLPRGVRLRLALLMVYLAIPIDLIPDVVPVLGYVDDAVVVAVALRSVVRHAGADAIRRHWPGTPEGLRVVTALAGVDRADEPRAGTD